jgi:hypothetical protein
MNLDKSIPQSILISSPLSPPFPLCSACPSLLSSSFFPLRLTPLVSSSRRPWPSGRRPWPPSLVPSMPSSLPPPPPPRRRLLLLRRRMVLVVVASLRRRLDQPAPSSCPPTTISCTPFAGALRRK